MSTGIRVSRDVAEATAIVLASALDPAVDRIAIAGSIRRGAEDVGDIELVAVPIIDTLPDGMFAERKVNRLTERIDHLIGRGILASHPTDPKRGDRYSKVVDSTTGLNVDIFSASPQTFGIILLIRTGPAEYSHRFVTDIRRRALHVAEGQLHRGSLGCGSYECEVVPTPDEESVYAAAGWPVVAPEWRA